MSGIRILIITIGALFVLVLLIGLLLPSKAHIERSVMIDLPADSVFLMVADFNHYLKWNPFSQMDPGAKHTISGTPATAGHCWSWTGDSLGTGKLTIEELTPGRVIRSSLVFTKPDLFESTEIWNFEPTNSGTRVTWINEPALNYPIGRFFGLFIDGMMGPEFEKGLSQLKSYSLNHFNKL